MNNWYMDMLITLLFLKDKNSYLTKEQLRHIRRTTNVMLIGYLLVIVVALLFILGD